MPPQSDSVDVSPKVLVWARASSGVTLEEVTRRLGIDPNLLAAWETGRMNPPLAKLEDLADIYHRSLATFLLREPPREPAPPTDLRVVSGTRKSLFSDKTLLAFRRARLVQGVAAELGEPPSERGLEKLQNLVLGQSAESAAGRVASDLNAYDQEPPRFESPHRALAHWKNLIGQLGIIVLQFPMPINDARGFTLADTPWRVLVVNKADQVQARSFTLLHEFAHLLKKKTGVCDLGEANNGANAPQTEVWCNGFAGSFLVPKTSLLNSLRPWPTDEPAPPEEIHRLSNRYQVSETVILRRLLDSGLISSTEYRESSEVRRGPSARSSLSSTREMKRNIPLERFSEFGAPFLGMVLRGASDGRLALTDLAEILDIRLKHLPAISDRVSRKGTGS